METCMKSCYSTLLCLKRCNWCATCVWRFSNSTTTTLECNYKRYYPSGAIFDL
uniref:SFRICE_026610 n=1 Tax=Spodoptera frugiperda TaxID=7108 RepID=A0A2H1V3Q7_SPOFR